MYNLHEWTNTSPFHRKRNAAIEAFTRKVDAARAERDAAFERANDYNDDLRLTRQREATEAYNAVVDAAVSEARAEFRGIVDGIREGFKKAVATAPSTEQVNFLTTFKLRSTATAEDAEAAFEAVRGNLNAVIALSSVLDGIKLEGLGTSMAAPFATYGQEKAISEAERHLERKVSHMSQYAAGGFFFVDLNAFDGCWTPLCHFLEFAGIH